MRQKKALITGATGQDGLLLSELLIEKGYQLFGTVRTYNLYKQLDTNLGIKYYIVDLNNRGELSKLILKIKPDEIYHLAAFHFSSQNDDNKKKYFEAFNNVNLLTTDEILASLKEYLPLTRFFYASSSHVFGSPDISPQIDSTPFRPNSFYSITKTAGSQLTKFYRDYHNIYASVGILYNHESPLRSIDFLSAQIAYTAAKASLGLRPKLVIRDLEGIVDWGSAKDYVNAMWLTLQQLKGDDYVIATGIPRRVKDFVKIAFEHVGLNSDDFIVEDPVYKKNSVIPYVGNPDKLIKVCGWESKISFSEMVIEIVDYHIKRLKMDIGISS
jgi:GDPmannose 4,6-dehydratase